MCLSDGFIFRTCNNDRNNACPSPSLNVVPDNVQTCRHKESVLSRSNHQIINLTRSFPESNCTDRMQEVYDYSAPPGDAHNGTNMTTVPIKVVPMIECYGSRAFLSRRERWWFIAVSNCDSLKGLRLKYRIIMTNDNVTSWNRHFSADQLCT